MLDATATIVVAAGGNSDAYVSNLLHRRDFSKTMHRTGKQKAYMVLIFHTTIEERHMYYNHVTVQMKWSWNGDRIHTARLSEEFLLLLLGL